MPVSSLIIRRQLNVDDKDLDELIKTLKLSGGKSTPFPQLPDKFYCFLKKGHKMGKAEPLFRPIKDDEAKDLKVRFAGKQDATATAADVGDKKKHKKEKKEETVSTISSLNSEELNSLIQSLNDQIKQVGDSVRTLKAAKAPKVKKPELKKE